MKFPRFRKPNSEPKSITIPCPKCSEYFTKGYQKGFAEAIKQYGIDKEGGNG